MNKYLEFRNNNKFNNIAIKNALTKIIKTNENLRNLRQAGTIKI